MLRAGRPGSEYTKEELEVLAKVRRDSGRTCSRCAWYRQSGGHRGCFPGGKYRKWLSGKEFEAGCEFFEAAEKE
jgi:hypothetical protein